MHRTRHPHARSSALRAVSLLSMLAVLACAFFPGIAQAEEATGIQYEPEVPTVPGKQKIPTKEKKSNSGESEANSSNAPSGGSGGGNTPGSGGKTNTGQSNQGNGSGGSPSSGGGQNSGQQSGSAGLGKETKVSNGTPASQSSGGSSSPLVPILIAVAALAAISIGAVVYRQRRGRNGSSFSPKAS